MKVEELKSKELKDITEMVEFKQVPIQEQKAMIEAIVNDHVKEDDTGFKQYDSINMEIAKRLSFISLFTDIELGKDDYENYDILAECGLNGYIDSSEKFLMYDWFFEERLKDAMKFNSMEHLMYKRTKELVGSIDKLAGSLGTMLEKGNPDKIAKILSVPLGKFVDKLPDFSKLDALDLMEELQNGQFKNDSTKN